MPRFTFTASPHSITVFVNGRQHIIGADHSGFRALSEHLKLPEHDAQFIEDCVDKAKFINRMTAGNITVQGSTVYYMGNPVHSTLTSKLVELLDLGYDAEPWALFMDNLMQNPSENSKSQLFDFLSSFNAPFTEDGCFLVFKRVSQDYKDVYTGKFDNSIGQVVKMDRNEVVDDPNQTCSAGLHVCSIGYLSSGYGSTGRTVACKVNPRDVVSVPVDYKFAKIRCCQYEVIGDVDETGSYTEDTVADATYVDTQNPTQDMPAVVNGSGIEYEVSGYDIYMDESVSEGDHAYHPESGRVGLVVSEYVAQYNDREHPENADWLNGYASGNEIYPVTMLEVDFGDNVETFTLYEHDDDLVLAELAYVTDEEAEGVVTDMENGGDLHEGELISVTPMGIVCYVDEDPAEIEKTALECRLLGATRDDMWPAGYDVAARVPANAYLRQENTTGIPEPVQLASRSGVTMAFTPSDFVAKVQELGQRGFDRQYDVPRTTVQDALRRLGDD